MTREMTRPHSLRRRAHVRPDARRGTKRRIGYLGAQLVLVMGILAAWQAGASIERNPAFPPFLTVLQSLVGILFGERLVTDVLPSITRTIVGFVVGVSLGTVAGIAIGASRGLEAWVRPVLEFVRAIPIVALLPAAILLLGATGEMQIALIAFGSFFPVLLAAIDGTRRVDPLYIDTSRMLGRSRGETLARVLFPAALPAILAGARTALGLALIVMVISELTAASNGVGYFIQQSQRMFRTADVYAGTLVIGMIGLLLTAAILAAERRLLRWHRGWRGNAEIS